MKAITPDKIETWKDQMRRYKTVNVPVDDFTLILKVVEGEAHAGCFCPHCNPSEDTKILDATLSALRRDQAARVMPVVTALLDFWEMMPNDEKDLVRTNPRLACLLDELDAAMEGDGPFTTDEVE